MVMTPAERLFDRRWFITNMLKVVDKDGSYRPLGTDLYPEQVQIIEAWEKYRYICILKPRQMGCSTITQALLFRDMLFTDDPVNALTVAHEFRAQARMNRMQRDFWRGLPRVIRPSVEPFNTEVVGFGKPDGMTAFSRVATAGGRGQGRSDTFHKVIFTEMGKYPQGSASTKGKQDADREAYASIQSTMHQSSPHFKLVVESTGDGPGGQFHDVVLTAQEDPNWAFLMFRWADFPMYEMEVPPGWDLRPDERDYGNEFLSQWGPEAAMRKLVWRRHKMETEGYSAMRFRREYPMTSEEPFLLSESTWFDSEMANRLLGRVPPHQREGQWRGALRVYHEPELGREYFVGGDTAGGTEGDYAVFVVIRDDFEVCAIWQSNTAEPHEQGNRGAELSVAYNGAMVCCEENNFGRVVNDRMEALGVPLLLDDNGKRFWSQGGRAGQTKKMVYSYARHVFNEQIACSLEPDQPMKVNDEALLHEIVVIRETDRGNIEAPSPLHDDIVDAWVLALWAGRYYAPVQAAPLTSEDAERQRMARMGLRV
jgi:hypothetical protein